MKYFIWTLVTLASLTYSSSTFAQTLNVDLMWEANSYTPAVYPGKALVTTGTEVRVIALTETKGLEYWWRLDNYDLPDYSGPERNSFSFRATKTAGGTHQVQLSLKQNGEVIRVTRLSIPVTAPVLAFYEQDPILGEIHAQAITSDFSLVKPELTVIAEPLFFNRVTVNSLKYTWKLNNTTVAPDGENGRVITFTVPAGGGKGANQIKLLAENPTDALQYAQNAFSIIFNSQNNDESLF